MTTYSQKYSLVTFLEDVKEGVEFHYSNWPLHVSIVDTFACDKIDELIRAIDALVSTTNSFQTEVGEDAYFGPDKQVRVKLIAMNEALISIHKEVVKILETIGAIFNDPQYVGDGYKAHTTVHSDTSVKTGDEIYIRKISLVDMFHNSDYQQRKVLKNIHFLPIKIAQHPWHFRVRASPPA